MEYTIIEVPDQNDSVSNVVLNDTYYQIRFTYGCEFRTTGGRENGSKNQERRRGKHFFSGA